MKTVKRLDLSYGKNALFGGRKQWLLRRGINAPALLAMLAGAAALFVTKAGCPFYRVFGVPCPGCGLTRAWLAVLRFDFAAAFGYNFMFWSVPLLALYVLFDGRPFPGKYQNGVVLSLIAVGFFFRFLLGLFAS